MEKRSKRWWLLVLAIPLLLVSCLKDDPKEGTIVLMGAETYVKGIEEVIDDTLLRVLADTSLMKLDSLSLYKGNTPPDVQGQFVFCPKELLWYNADQIAAGDSICFRFGGDVDTLGCYPEGQHNRVVPLDYQEDAMMKHTDTAYLMGNKDRFTAYFELTHNNISDIPGVNFNLRRGYVIMGRMSPRGDKMLNVRVACINLQLVVNSNNVAVSGVQNEFIEAMKGRIFVYRVQDDGPVLRQNWYHTSN